MRSLALSRAAANDLAEISAYSMDNFGYDVAFAYMHALDATMDRLLDFLELGSVVPEIAGHPRCVSCNRHRIFYQIESETIAIIRILHHKMNAVQWLG